ncbi:MAG TPA: hypothetical protein VH744_11340 [Terriglobales bacterium]
METIDSPVLQALPRGLPAKLGNVVPDASKQMLTGAIDIVRWLR